MKIYKSIAAIVLMIWVLTSFNTRPIADTYQVDPDASELKWTGYHLAKSYEHWGNIKIKSGSLSMEGDKIIAGEIVIDMNSISNGDLEKEKENAKLVRHLKSKDFFAVDEYAEAKLVIKDSKNEGNNYSVTADLTIKGITKTITFDATKTDSDGKIMFNAGLKVKRTDYKVMYGWKLENAILSDDFKMDIKLVASK